MASKSSFSRPAIGDSLSIRYDYARNVLVVLNTTKGKEMRPTLLRENDEMLMEFPEGELGCFDFPDVGLVTFCGPDTDGSKVEAPEAYRLKIEGVRNRPPSIITEFHRCAFTVMRLRRETPSVYLLARYSRFNTDLMPANS